MRDLLKEAIMVGCLPDGSAEWFSFTGEYLHREQGGEITIVTPERHRQFMSLCEERGWVFGELGGSK